MTEDPKEKQTTENQTQDYQFINEQIVSKKKKRFRRRLESFVFVVIMAVVFGMVARYVFLISGDALAKFFGIEEEPDRHTVDLPRATATVTVKPTPTPTKRLTPTPTTSPQVDVTPNATGEPGTNSPEVTQEPNATDPQPSGSDITGGPLISGAPSVTGIPGGTVTPGGDENQDPSENPNIGANSSGVQYSYALMYQEIINVANKVSNQLVTIDAVEQSVDWFQEVYQTRTKTTGLIVGNDGIDLLILTDYLRVIEADTIEVTLGKNTVIEGSIFSSDKDYGLAIVSVPLEKIPEDVLSEVQIAMLASEDKVYVGVPVIALGAPNGYADSMEFGMITSLGGLIPVVDGQVKYFTTNLTDYAQGHGFIVNLQGEILGMMTHTYKTNIEDGIASAVTLDAMRGVIVKLLNHSDFAYVGIKGMNLPAELQLASGIASGVYVKEVDAASPAFNAGIKSGDILIVINKKAITGINVFTQLLLDCSTKDTLAVTLLRMQGGGTKQISVDINVTKKAE